jgi:hypothetical protein
MVNQKKQCAVLLGVEPGGGEIVGWDCQTHCYTDEGSCSSFTSDSRQTQEHDSHTSLSGTALPIPDSRALQGTQGLASAKDLHSKMPTARRTANYTMRTCLVAE